MIFLPNIYLYMPHVKQHPNSLIPNVVLGQRHGVKLVKQSNLVSTLSSLLYSLTSSQYQDLLIIIFVAEMDWDYVISLAETIKRKYLFRCGNIEMSADKFYNTTVEVLPSNVSQHKIVTDISSDNSFIIIGALENGVAEGEVVEALQPISALRLVVHSNSDVWVLLSDV